MTLHIKDPMSRHQLPKSNYKPVGRSQLIPNDVLIAEILRLRESRNKLALKRRMKGGITAPITEKEKEVRKKLHNYQNIYYARRKKGLFDEEESTSEEKD